MIMRLGIILFLTTFLYACISTDKSTVWKSNEFVFSDNISFLIQPASSATENVISQEMLSFFTENIKEQFKKANLKIKDLLQENDGILFVKSEILEYQSPHKYGSGIPPAFIRNTIAICIIRTRLFKKTSDNYVAEIITVNKLDSGEGLLVNNPPHIFKESATTIAKEVKKIMGSTP